LGKTVLLGEWDKKFWESGRKQIRKNHQSGQQTGLGKLGEKTKGGGGGSGQKNTKKRRYMAQEPKRSTKRNQFLISNGNRGGGRPKPRLGNGCSKV